MEKLKPKLFSVMKTYTKEQFFKDLIAGLIVAIIALPLSIALAIASGVTPERGIYTAIVAGFIISFLGGSRVQISGPTAAFATVVAGIVLQYGMEGLAIATIMAGLMLILMGILKLGALIKFIPYTITTGFTTGIAITIFIGQIKDFLGLTIISEEPLIETIDKVKAIAQFIGTINYQAVLIGIICMVILIIFPMLPGKLKKIPGSLIAVFISIGLVKGLGVEVNTIGDLYEITIGVPSFSIPSISLDLIKELIPSAMTIAVLAGIESLLSCVVSDGMVHSKHRSNMELVAQGVGNIGSALFGGIPATGAIARTSANVKNGGRTPVAGMVHAVILLIILTVLMPYAAWIPMPTIAAILFMVAYNMSEWKSFVYLCKTSPKSDILVLVVTFILTVVFDLVIAIEFGIILTALLFIKRMSDVAMVRGWKYIDDEKDMDSLELKVVPKNTLVYEISGPMFFGAADKLLQINVYEDCNVLILRMRSSSALDATAMRNLEQLYEKCKKNKVTLVLSHVNEQPLALMKKTGFIQKVGDDNVCSNLDKALLRAKEIQNL